MSLKHIYDFLLFFFVDFFLFLLSLFTKPVWYNFLLLSPWTSRPFQKVIQRIGLIKESCYILFSHQISKRIFMRKPMIFAMQDFRIVINTFFKFFKSEIS